MFGTIRRFTFSDAAACCGIINACIDRMDEFDAPTRAFLHAKNVPDRLGAELAALHTLVCEDGGRAVGLGAREGDRIMRVFVDPEQQGRGIGAALMAALEALAPVSELTLESSLGAVTFYERLGYRRQEQTVERVGDATFRHVEMIKRPS